LREDAQKLKEENTKLEGMVESRDELIMEITKEIGLVRMGEDAEAKDEDDDDGGDAATPEGVVVEEDPVEMVPEQETHVAHEVIFANAEPELPQPRLYRMLMRDYEESPSRMMDDLNDLDGPTEASSNMDDWFPEDGINDGD
jgi:hypothetical protein